jgi:hypothetical protein
LLITVADLAHADIYRCKETDGTTIFTDNLLNVPMGCQTDKVRVLPRSVAIPSNPSPPAKQIAIPKLSTSKSKQKQSERGESAYYALKGEAESLVEQYLSTRKEVFRSSLTRDKQRARRELTEIRSQKGNLLREVDQSPLHRSKKKEISAILSSISE